MKFAQIPGLFFMCISITVYAADTVPAQSSSSTPAPVTLKKIENEELQRIAKGQQAQQTIDALAKQTRSKIDEYQSHLKLVEGLRRYNSMLQKQLDNQQEEIGTLNKSIGDVALVERQILPLMSRMIDGLEDFIKLDIPFLPKERKKRIADLRNLLTRSDVTVAEKTRRVLEAYQVENEYGRTIEAYKAKLNLKNASFDADFLRIGRIALMYRTVGNEEVGFWDNEHRRWEPLDSVPYRRYIELGLKVARQQVAPKLISIPIDPAEEIRR